jgi:hypothetical protein
MYSQKWNCTVHTLFPNSYILVSVSDLLFPGSVCLFGCSKQADQSWEYINRSQLHKCGNWETEYYNFVLEIMRPRRFILGIHKSEPDIYIWFSPALHLQCANTGKKPLAANTTEEEPELRKVSIFYGLASGNNSKKEVFIPMWKIVNNYFCYKIVYHNVYGLKISPCTNTFCVYNISLGAK